MIQVIQQVADYIDILSMKNDQLEVVVSNYGCTIMKVLMKDKDGHIDDVVLGYDDFSQYQTLDAYLGALVGRVANRIKLGKFTLNNQEYSLAINNGPNAIHGGIKGFSYQVFDYKILNDETIIFHYLSQDGEEGYPGNLDFYATYTLEGNTLKIQYKATTDQDTLINITNHTYFNLSGKTENIYQHLLTVKADQYACIDKDGLTTGVFNNVKDTPFDFNKPAYIGERVNQDDVQLHIGKGFDHPFILTTYKNQVILEHPKTSRRLSVSTSLPIAQIYTANYLDGRLGKYGQHYYERDAVCIETENLPDAIHLENHPTTILKKGETYDEYTSYKFEVI
ncbi:MAG: galactose mutarotase [Erysipelotrichaceae bacterium]|nr:galactose mutarotase [Erysipelotrichaceae bacterium]